MRECIKCQKDKTDESFHYGFLPDSAPRTCIECGKTGTLKPPSRPGVHLDFDAAEDKAKNMCKETRQDVVVYHDERGGLSQRTVRDSNTMHLPFYVLGVYRFSHGRVVEQLGIIDIMVVDLILHVIHDPTSIGQRRCGRSGNVGY